MKLKLHIAVTNAESNAVITLQHTGIDYPTRSIIHEVEIEIPDPPRGFDVQRITIAKETPDEQAVGQRANAHL